MPFLEIDGPSEVASLVLRRGVAGLELANPSSALNLIVTQQYNKWPKSQRATYLKRERDNLAGALDGVDAPLFKISERCLGLPLLK